MSPFFGENRLWWNRLLQRKSFHMLRQNHSTIEFSLNDFTEFSENKQESKGMNQVTSHVASGHHIRSG